MFQIGRRQPSRRARHRIVALITTITATATGFGAQAFADDRPFAIPPGSTTAPATKVDTPPNGPLQIARAKAKSTGKPVTVDELTTEKSLMVANPDGTVTLTSHAQPARVKQNGKWTAVDATLGKNTDGTFSPKATPSGVALSGGGNGPLAAFTDPAGHHLALTLPFALPAPAVNGDTATYTNVLPGVDLKATVTDQGAFREVLVVHDATAAANPQLKALKLATSSNGLTTTADANGNLTAKAADGTAAFSLPTPVMWDSAKPAKGAAPRALSDPAATPTGKNTGPVEATDVTDSSDKGPGRGAHITALKVQADNSSLTLTPDAGVLGDSSTVWPLYFDPYVNPAPGGTNHYTEVKEGCPSQALYDQAQTNGEGIGFQQYDPNCYGIYRSFYNFDISNLNSRMVVQSSTAYFTETYGADNGCNNTWPVNLELTGSFYNTTAWPGPNVMWGVANTTAKSASISSACGNRPVNFDITSTVKSYITNGNLTFGLTGDEGKYGTNYGFMRFSTNPYLQTVFDIAPNQPTGMSTTPNSQNPNGAACGSGSPGWIGMTSLNGNAANINLNATVSTDMSGVNLKAGYHVWDNMANNGSGSPADASWPVSPNWVASGTPVSTNIGGPVSDGHQYGWNVWATDGALAGPGSSYCYFNVDLTPPTLASITPSTVFPPLGSGSAPTGHAGDAATVTVSSKDPVPTGCTLNACIASGVDHFQYSLDSNVPVGGGTAAPVVSTDANGNSTANISIQVPSNQWGTHTLYIRAVDKAGNTQAAPATYSFYAPWNPNAKVTPGDLTGDGIPDILATTTEGNLALLKGNADPSVTPEIASTASQAPDANNHDWSKYLIAHRGSLTQSGKDDLFAYSKPTQNLYSYKNDATATPPGTPGHFSNTQSVSTIGHPTCRTVTALSCTNYPADWSQLTQMAAPGPLAIAAYNAANPTQQQALSPDLITVENGQLWYLMSGGSPSSFYGAYPIGTGDWSTTTLVGVGMVGATVTGTGSTATTTGGTPTLWVRNNTTGTIYSYTLTFDNNGDPTSTFTSPAGGTTTQPTLPVTLKSTDYPAVTTPGDVNGDGNPDLYATGPDGKISVFPGAAPVQVTPPTDRWQLADTTDSIRPANGLTLNGGATIGTDNTDPTLSVSRGNVYIGNGTTAYANSAATSIDTSKSFTVSAWVNLPTIPTQNVTAVAQDGTQNSGFYLQYNAGVKNWCLTTMANDTATSSGSGLSPCATGTVAPKSWYHLVGVYDATAKTAQLYVNGTLAATATGLTNWSATGSLTIGAALYHGTRTDYFPGMISDVKTFAGALPAGSSTGDVTSNAQFGPATTLGYIQTPLDRWKLTDTSDSIPGRSNTLTLTGGATFVNDATRGTVLNLDGATGTRASTAGTIFDTTKSYTVSAWAYLTNTNGYATVIGESGSNASAFYLQYSKAFNAWTFISPSSDSANPTSYPNVHASTAPDLNRWTHLVGVYDASAQTMSLYVNGALVGTTTNTSAWAATGPLTIGNALNENPFAGEISDVQTWNSALPAAAVATLNSGTLPVPVQLS